ncbi:MAG: hypothetical protein WBP11_06060 [Dokdonella sp.]
MFRRVRHRRITIFLMIASLLFQQLTMAAYACTMTQMPADEVMMAADCDAVASKQFEPSTTICQKHCNPDATSASTQSPLEVPALGLPPVSFGLAFVPEEDQSEYVSQGAFAPPDTPPRLRYCRLLI